MPYQNLNPNAPYDQLAPLTSAVILFIVALIAVDIVLKGWGMWRAARLGKSVWFVVLLLVNFAGILPLVFLIMTNAEYNKKFHPTKTKKIEKPKAKPRKK